MMKRLTILCISAFLVAGVLGCEAKTRYHVLCLLFDGVPTPPGMVPCDGKRPGQTNASKGNGNGVNSPKYTAHGPYAARLCEGCHQRQTNKLLMAKEELCLNCHVLSLKKKKVHGPVASGGCTICHDPHGSGNKYLLVAKSQEFCLYCHQREDILMNDAHEGIDATSCTTCHNAHASDNDYLLRDTPELEASPGWKKREASPRQKRREASPEQKKREASPQQKRHEASPEQKKREASPQQKRHEASPRIKPYQNTKQQFAETAKASTNNLYPDGPERKSDRQDAPIQAERTSDAKAF